MLSVENITVNYPNFQLHCSLKLEKGMITGIVGENGAGKTTLFKAILGLAKISRGEIIVNDAVNEFAEFKKQTGVVLAESFFNELFTLQDLQKILPNIYPNFNQAYFEKNCAAFKLPPKQKLQEYSTGMRAKLKTICALSHEARLLILDEPTSGLDISARNEILELLQDYLLAYPESSILISSHITSDLAQICDDLYYLKAGEIFLHEETDVLLDNYGILKVPAEDYVTLQGKNLLSRKKRTYGYDVLTNQRRFYQENYPQMVVEKPSIDEILLLMMEGETA